MLKILIFFIIDNLKSLKSILKTLKKTVNFKQNYQVFKKKLLKLCMWFIKALDFPLICRLKKRNWANGRDIERTLHQIRFSYTHNIAHDTNVPIASLLVVTCNDNILIALQILIYLLN